MPIASSLEGVLHLAGFDEVARKRYEEELSLYVLMAYALDTVPEAALEVLADQFDVLGWKGWKFADTDAKKRALLKSAFKMHKTKGTPFSIKEACRVCGFEDPELIEGFGLLYDGTRSFDGSWTYSGGNWASFAIRIIPPDDLVIDAENLAGLGYLIDEYKPASRHLINITFKLFFVDGLPANDDSLIFDDEPLVDSLTGGFLYDGTQNFDGTNTYRKRVDRASVRIIDNLGNILEDGTF